jgi:methionyl-tRNA formyltransferase
MTRSPDDPMTLVFCGTPQFAVPTLERLVQTGFPVRLALTQPDRPKGRGLELMPSPVKETALRLEIPVYQPDRIKNNEELRTRLSEINPAAIIVVGYGRIIPKWMLALPKYGNINLHASLLPKYRGAAPIQWAIASGETVTGVTTMRIDEGLDTGDILLQKEMEIAGDDTAVALAPKLATVGGDLMIETLRSLEAGTITPRSQNNAEASLAPILNKEAGRIDFSRTAKEIYNRFRGFQPWPGAFTTFRDRNLRGRMLAINAARPSDQTADPKLVQGQLLFQGSELFVVCGQRTVLQLLEVQPEGKKRISPLDFIHGYDKKTGDRLGV